MTKLYWEYPNHGYSVENKQVDEIKTTENIQITTSSNLSDTNIAHLKGFKRFLEWEIIESGEAGINDLDSSDHPEESWVNYKTERFKDMVKNCKNFIAHIDSILGYK